MKTCYAFVASNISVNYENGIASEAGQDPFHEIAEERQEPALIRHDEIVFSEPILNFNTNGCLENAETISIDNVTVVKRKGKRNKYHIHNNMQETSKPTCPQSNCGKTFSSPTLLKAHVRKVHCKQLSHMCHDCGALFTQQYLLERHSSRHREKVCCTVCRKMLSATSLHNHMRSHANTRPHQCSVCNKSFHRKSILNNHLKFVHKNGGITCSVCGESFAMRSKWTRHKTLCRKETKK